MLIKFLFKAFFLLLIFPFGSMAAISLAERLVTLNTAINYDEVYNKALEEMQNLPTKEKEKLSKELSAILLNDSNSERRANAAMAIGDMCSEVKSNAQYLVKSAKDKEKFVRQGTVSALKKCGKSPEVITAIKSLNKDPDETVRVMVEMALEE